MSIQEKHFSLGPNEGEALFVLGDVVTFKIAAAETATPISWWRS